MRARTSSRGLGLLLVAFVAACNRQPNTAYSFDTAPGGWEFSGHRSSGGASSEEYTHPVHAEAIEVFEVARAAPGSTSAEFTALPPAQRVLPTLGDATTTMRALGDDDVNGVQGYWVAQYGRDGSQSLQAAVFIVPSGRRHFVVRLRSPDDEIEHLQGWARDTLLRNFRFPAPVR